MTGFMDIRFPEFPAPRDTGSEPAPRKSHAENSDFAEMLDRSLDEPREKLRDVAAEKPVARHAAERADADVEPNQARSTQDDAADTQTESGAAPTPEAKTTEPPTSPTEKPLETSGDPVAAAPAASGEQAVAPPPQTIIPLAPAPIADASPQAAQPQGALQAAAPAAAPAVPVDGKTAPVVPTGAAGKPAPQADFASELAAAAVTPAEPVAAKPKSTQKSEPKSAPAESVARPDPAQTVTVAAVTATPAAPDTPPKDSRNPGTEPAVAQTTANTQPAASAAIAGTSSAMPEATPDATDAQIVALVRPAANVPAADRPAAAPAPVEAGAKEPVLDAKPPAEQAKPEAPSRPFGAVAPGLSIAAQAAGQQTPEQASAAERLAQLAAAPEAEAGVKATHAAADAAKSTDTGAPASRIDQVGQADAAATRPAANDAAAASAAARSARPAAHPMITQIAAHVAQAAIEGNDRISIRLSPAELGRIDVKLEVGPDGRVQAVFAADRAQTVDLLQRDARDLERALQDAGLRADSGSLSFNLRGDGRNGTQNGAAGQPPRDEPVVELNNPQLQAYAAGGGTSGRLDLRI